MKKQNLLKLALVTVAMLLFVGAMAQTYPATIETDYEAATENTFQTVGHGLTLYVAPDPALSPGYTGTGTAGINPTARWTWTVGATVLGVTPNNYVEISAADITAVGAENTLAISAVESIDGLSCPGSTRNHTISVVAAPTANIAVTPSADWSELTAGVEWQTCADGLSETITISFTELGLTDANYARYAYRLDVTAVDYDENGLAGTAGTTSYGPAIDGTLVTSPATQAITFDLGTGASRTQYTINLQAGSIGSQISRISQYRGGAASYTYYDPATTTFTFWVNKAPTTGPIYHIPNDFSNF